MQRNKTKIKMKQNSIFEIKSQSDFEKLSLDIFHFQAEQTSVYSKYLHYLNINHHRITDYHKIPFLPIFLFKTHKIISDKAEEQIIFTSSGTTGINTSKHYVKNLEIYEESFFTAFKYFYGNIEDYCILALLPAYLERKGSSLIYMTEKLIEKSKNKYSGFYLHNTDELVNKLQQLEKSKTKTLLIGVSFALLSLIEKYKLNLKHTLIMETGGMKGRRKELTRQELHSELSKGLGVKKIHSEYGMTELLSQAYSKGDGFFETPPWMKVLIRDTYDPFSFLKDGKTGGINVIDLANINSCSFIETQDLGKKQDGKKFEILGRFDSSDIRGCNLLIE